MSLVSVKLVTLLITCWITCWIGQSQLYHNCSSLNYAFVSFKRNGENCLFVLKSFLLAAKDEKKSTLLFQRLRKNLTFLPSTETERKNGLFELKDCPTLSDNVGRSKIDLGRSLDNVGQVTKGG